MALHDQQTFSTGELDPVLAERITLAKYKAGLKTARNVVIGRAGNIVSRPGRVLLNATKIFDSPVVLYTVPRTGTYLEVGVGYVRIYNNSFQTLAFDTATSYVAADLKIMQFETSKNYVYIFVGGKAMTKLNWTTGAFVASPFAVPVPGGAFVNTPTGTPAGYQVDYCATYVISGEESLPVFLSSGGVSGTLKVPIANGQSNFLTYTVGADPQPNITQVNIYRRPTTGSAFGFIGSTNYFVVGGGNVAYQFTDVGGAADYTHAPPALINQNPISTIAAMNSPCGCVYQQRLVLASELDVEAVITSRPGYQNNFFNNFPVDGNSALSFKTASNGTAQILRFLDSYGLNIFTTQGVFISLGQLDPLNLSAEKRVKSVIDPKMQPLAIPGGVLFVDVMTNCVRSLNWSQEMGGYTAEDVGVYSGHLFRFREITSWGFQEGRIPFLWVTFDDGTYSSFTYEFEQDMRAWTRHDSENLFVEQVSETGIAETSLFLVRDINNNRYVEMTIPRYIPVSKLTADPYADKEFSIAAMDSIITAEERFEGTLRADPQTSGDWSDNLVITDLSASSPFAVLPPTIGGVQTFRWFSLLTKQAIDLQFVSQVDQNTIVVKPLTPFPAAENNFSVLFGCLNTISGLSHLEGQYPGVIVDGSVVCSPNNDIDNFIPAQVQAGVLVLPPGVTGAIIHVGRVYSMDAETLDVDTIEQKPSRIESMTINKLYIRAYLSRGLYVGTKFPDNDLISGMEQIDRYFLDYSQANPISGNRYKQPQSRRYEISLGGDWSSNGRICIRQADPLHFEILSVIPDAEIHWRVGG